MTKISRRLSGKDPQKYYLLTHFIHQHYSPLSFWVLQVLMLCICTHVTYRYLIVTCLLVNNTLPGRLKAAKRTEWEEWVPWVHLLFLPFLLPLPFLYPLVLLLLPTNPLSSPIITLNCGGASRSIFFVGLKLPPLQHINRADREEEAERRLYHHHKSKEIWRTQIPCKNIYFEQTHSRKYPLNQNRNFMERQLHINRRRDSCRQRPAECQSWNLTVTSDREVKRWRGVSAVVSSKTVPSCRGIHRTIRVRGRRE